MAYQNVGTPRFYIDYFQFAMATATGSPYNDASFGLNTSKQYSHSTTDFGGNVHKTFKSFHFTGAIPKLNYIAVLGHNFGDFTTGGFNLRLDSATVTDDYVERPSDYEIVNADFSSNYNAQYSGFSIVKITEPSTPEDANRIKFRLQASEAYNIKGSAFSTGNIYEMPHSPNLSLTMSREYGGIKEFTTMNGSSMSNTMWSKPPAWGELGAWELGSGNPALSRSGRRTWDLKFSYLDDSDVFGSNQSLSLIRHDQTDGADSGDIANDGNFNYTLLTDENFFSQVWHKTLGGTLPFIFQPDKDNNNPDQFAICKFKDNSLKADQSAHNIYDISLSIEEVW